VRLRSLNAQQISQMMDRLSHDEIIPRAYTSRVVRAVIDDPNHPSMFAIVDAIDSSIPSLESLPDTLSNVGSEGRISLYGQRFADGQALFHDNDTNVCTPPCDKRKRGRGVNPSHHSERILKNADLSLDANVISILMQQEGERM